MLGSEERLFERQRGVDSESTYCKFCPIELPGQLKRSWSAESLEREQAKPRRQKRWEQCLRRRSEETAWRKWTFVSVGIRSREAAGEYNWNVQLSSTLHLFHLVCIKVHIKKRGKGRQCFARLTELPTRLVSFFLFDLFHNNPTSSSNVSR